MKIFSLLQIKYYQFESAVKEVLSNALSRYGTQYGNNTIFGQLINVLNGVVQNMMLYIEDSMVEQNIYTAQRKKSIYGLATLSGYQPHLGKAAGVQLSVNYIPTNVSNLNIVLNNHESVTCTQNGLTYNFVLPQEAIIMSADRGDSRYIYAVQGKFETQTFISTGGKYYSQNFNFMGNLDVDYITIKVNGSKWDYQCSLYDMVPDGKQWTYKVSPISGIDILFGNGQHGRPIKNGDVIEISYLVHDGESGNLDVTEETYFVFNDLLKDINGDEVDGNNVFNVTYATGDAVTSGSNSESIEQVRKMAGFNSRSLVLASPDNYKTFLNKFSFCGYNRTWTEKGSLVINSLVLRNYKLLLNDSKTYFDLTESDFKLTDYQKSSIINCIEGTGNQLAGVSYNIFDPEICKYALYMYIKLKSANSDRVFVSNKIRNIIAEFFTNVNSDIFIPKSDIIQLVKNEVPEVDGVDIYFLSERNETALQTGQYIDKSYNFDPSTGKYTIKKNVVYLYDGENPNLGLDAHGNIYLSSDSQFPVLMGGWDYLNNKGDEVAVNDPLIIVYE